MNVLLINPPSMTGEYNATELSPTFNDLQHSGLAYIAGMLERNGVEVKVLECDCEKISVDELTSYIIRTQPAYIGLSVYFYNYDNVKKILQSLCNDSAWNPFIFAGGYYASLYTELLLSNLPNLNCCVIGEGENTTVELVLAYSLHKSIKEVNGIAYFNNGKIVYTKPREVEHNLHAFDYPKISYISKSKNAGVVTSRGCLGNCSFCSNNSYYKKLKYPVRFRNAESIVNEIELLVHQGVTHIQFLDDNFLFHIYSKENTIINLCKLLKEKNLNINIYIYARAKEIIKAEEELKYLKSVGLTSLFVGVESFVERQLKLYNKKTTPEENFEAIRVLNKLGLAYTLGLILLDPYVTVEEFNTNLNALLDLKVYDKVHDLDYPISISAQLGVIPDTDIYYELKADGVLDEADFFGFNFVNEDFKLYLASIENWKDRIRNLYFYIQKCYSKTGDNFYNDLKKELLLKDIEFLQYKTQNYKNNQSEEMWISYLDNVEERIKGDS